MKKPSAIVRYAKPGGTQEDGPQEQECFIAVDRDVVSEEEYEKSCKNGSANYGILVLAIGKWVARRNYPKNRPQWALEACRKLYERSQVAMQPLVSPSLGPTSSETDEQLLERIADVMRDPDLRPPGLKPGLFNALYCVSLIQRGLTI